ncbi:alpha-protein kinase 3 isoform X1 [Danio rerio]|uniref:non-specific serine/threonine protein kinase n=3 Tax=Danio rerio TaxID=7955 RepID=A0A8M9PFU6_DANRE|nr:alpha-protein kinase 3 isoform X1 [Danio rerio]XP_021323494.1 alpha-protein kinase 3 isoform X1 [Danio rerio]XP_021328969.1 alpha-protein kinase 3 isoform X1 [Danio rerio]XP_021328970.1 alpha-protein kinase 3 isoform X1 [Danio rerio]|eukprot:XP_021323493.1 alpha-protein kinase 3 isoform X1 [Danio rerio]
MTSRRPMTRSYSGNGRSGNQNGEDVPSPSGRSESRNYLSNVRPENRYSNYRPSRSTLCTVMAQLTEETQPCFETTIKSKAVSESCNVKFSCVVTGYPCPELTWYKDDMELDRYCGLPKYEIFRNGKTHTLHIYNCTEEDAAIYQASARNSKGIVSCSGVLEVGTMSEYLIHQRFFAKLKQKAENKRREMEESRRRGKENIQKEQLNIINQERLLRKRRTPAENEQSSSSPTTRDEEENVTSQGVEEEQPAVNDKNITQQASVGTTEKTENGVEKLNHICDPTELAAAKQSAKEKPGEKKMRITNGFDEVGIVSPTQSNIQQEDGYEGISLAKYLTESVQSPASEEHHSPALMEIDVGPIKDKEQERELEKERERLKEEERERSRETKKEREREKVRQTEQEQKASASTSITKAASNKDQEPPHKSALTSVFHSLKDIFFGKSKKSTESSESTSRSSIDKEIPHGKHLISSKTPSQESLVHSLASKQEASKLIEESSQIKNLEVKTNSSDYIKNAPKSVEESSQMVTLEVKSNSLAVKQNSPSLVEESFQTADLEVKTNSLPQMQDSAIPNDIINSKPPEHITELSLNTPEAGSSTPEKHPENTEATLRLSVEQKEMPKEDISPEEVVQISHSSLFKAKEDQAKPSRTDVPDSVDLANPPCRTELQEFTYPVDEVMQGAEEINIVEKQGAPAAPLTDLIMADLESMQCCESQPESQLSQPADTVPTQVHIESQSVELRVEESKELCASNEKVILHMEESVIKMPEEDFLKEKKGHQDSAIERKSFAAGKNEMEIGFGLKQSIIPVIVVSERECEINDQNSALGPSPVSALGLSQEVESVTLVSDSEMEIDLKPDVKSIPVLNVNLTEDKKVSGSTTVNNLNQEENLNDKRISNQSSSAEEKGKDNVEKSNEKENEKKNNVIAENLKDDFSQPKKNNVKKTKNLVQETEATTIIPEKEIPKSQKRGNSEVTEAQLKPYKVETPKIQKKIQAERRLTEKDQSAAQPIIILPDTRETVIKNVAKKRSTPLIPEIKVTLPERVKREEPVIAPRSEILKLEPERVMQPLTQEVAQIFRERERPIDDATRTSGESVSNSALVISDHLGVMRNNQSSTSGDKVQDIKPQSLEARVKGGEEQGSLTTGMVREEDNNIPTINIACADDNTLKQDQTHSQSLLPGIVISQDITQGTPPISTINAERSGDYKKDFDTVVSMLKSESDQHRPIAASEKPKEQLMSHLSITNQDLDRVPQPKDTRVDPEADRLQKDKPSIEKTSLTAPVGPTLPPLSPASLRRLMAKNNPNLENQGSVSAASVDGSEKKGEESGGSTPTSTLSCESSPKMKRRDSLTLIPSATPEELASGARRKIYLAKTKSEDEGSDTQGKRDSPYMSPSQARRAAFLQLQSGQQTPPTERRSPLMARRKATLEVPKPKEEMAEVADNTKIESKPAEKEKLDPFKAPQVIRKIRGEPFSDASGHLKLWCQFFNILSDSTIKWYRDEEEIVELERRAGDEGPVALAIVQASSRDCGVYGCSIKNEYGTDITDYLLSADILAEFFLREDLEVGEEIEMTPMMFTKGLADSGYWGEKFFGRIMTEEVQIGEGCLHKTCRAKVIYGLDPIFESGSTCITKVRNPIAYGAKEESNLTERSLEITKQNCKIQNTIREYCKIFAAEARVIENFGFSLEVIPLHLMYRPANTIPYASVESDLKGVYVKYSLMDNAGRLIAKTASEVEQKCCTFQHWIHQWTNGNLLVTRLEGVDTKITSIEIATKSKGYQGLTDKGSPKIIDQFIAQHQCNYYCGLLGLRPLKPIDSLQQPKIKTSRSPLLARRGVTGSSSPQLQKKGTSPQSTRKGTSSPKVAKKTGETGENNSTSKHKTVEVPKTVRMR